MGKAITAAVVGCGWAGRRHAQAFTDCGVQIRWAIDARQERAEAIRKLQPAASISTDYREALQDPEVLVIDICLPHDLHAPVAVEAASSGKHVLCEKPIATTLEQANSMIVAAERAGVLLMVAENIRFNPVCHVIRNMLEKGIIGQPALVQLTREAYLTHSFIEERPWFLDARAAAGGILMSAGVHDFEKLRMIIGEIESVEALQAPKRFKAMQGDDTVACLIRFSNGAIGTMVESFIMKDIATASGNEVLTLRIDGDLGSIKARETEGAVIRVFSERKSFEFGAPSEQETWILPGDTFKTEIEHLLECIRTGKEPITSGRTQTRPLEIVLAAYESINNGKRVNV